MRDRLLRSAVGMLAGLGLLTMPAYAQQASLTLENGAAAPCYHNNTEWTIDKDGVFVDHGDGTGSALWTVTVTRGATSNNLLTVDGYLRIRNTGTADATVGNIVVNLQKRAGTKWVSAAVDVADATNGDAATSANIVAAASQEAPNLYNYVKSGSQGTFSETAGSGTLEFTDAVFNTAFSLVPQIVIPPGNAIDLLYQATFNNSILAIPTGASLRSEIIVTFGNSGIRGGSGSSALNININGDTGVDNVAGDGLPVGQSGADDGDEKNVRSVPDRQTIVLPALEKCNDSVALSDLETDVVGTGTVSFSSFSTDIGGGTGQENTSTSITRYVSVEVNGGTDGGSITNCAHLAGQSDSTIVYGPIDPNTGLPMFSYEFPCCTGVDLQDCSSFDVKGHVSISACTFTQGGWGGTPHGDNPAQRLSDNFAAVYPSGV